MKNGINKVKYMKYVILCIVLIFMLTGCNPVEPIPEPITEIYIEPAYTEIRLGESVELRCIDQLGRSTVAIWSKRCNAGNLSVEIGETCVYTTPRTMQGVQIIWAQYEGLKAEARVNGVK